MSAGSAAPGPAGTALLDLRGVSRWFGGVRAVNDVTFALPAGQIMGLIGPNGAGKTTLFNVVSGVLKPTAGRVLFDGTRIDALPTHRVARLGLARTFQNLRLFSSLTVLENVSAVLATRHVRVPGLIGSATARDLLAPARALLRRVDLDDVRDAPARALPYGLQRRLEIARALALEPRLLLLDEPSAGLSHGEAEALVRLVRELHADGLTVLLIEHNMTLVRALADTIAVLDHGELIALGTPEQIAADPVVIEAYLGSSQPSAVGHQADSLRADGR